MGKGKIGFGVLLGCALIAAGAWFLGRQSAANTRVLADGSIFKLEAVSVGKVHNFSAGVGPGWQKWLVRFLPSKLQRSLKLSYAEATMTLGDSNQPITLGVLTSCEEKTLNYSSDSRLRISDEDGNCYDVGRYAGSSMIGRTATNSFRTDGWLLAVFPRRSPKLKLQYSIYFSGKDRAWTENENFTIDNPFLTNPAPWTAEALPLTRTNGTVAVTLRSLASGMSDEGNEAASTEAIFEITEAGKPCPWRPKAIEISDATGNRWEPPSWRVRQNRDKDLERFVFKGSLWPGEPAWKLRVELSSNADFALAELWTLPPLPVPGDHERIDLGIKTNFHGSEIELVAFTGRKGQQPAGFKERATLLPSGTIETWATLLITRRHPQPGEHVIIVRITDDQGETVPWSRYSEEDHARIMVGVKVQPHAKSISAVLAVHKSKFVEFTVRPEFPSNLINTGL